MGVEEMAGWLRLPQSSPIQIVLDTSGCPAESQESWPLSGPGAGQRVLVVWGWCPFPGGDSKGIFSLPNEREGVELMFLVHQEL